MKISKLAILLLCAVQSVYAQEVLPEASKSHNGKSSQTIIFATVADQSFGAAPFSLSASSSVALPIVYRSETTNVCAVSGSTVTLLSVGKCRIVAEQAGDTGHHAAKPAALTFAVNKSTQEIDLAPLSPQTLGAPSFDVRAVSSAGLDVTLSSMTPAVCKVAGKKVSMLSAGVCSIAADQAGNTTTSAAKQTITSMSVMQTAQTITFGVLPGRNLGTGTFKPVATASSGLPVSFSTSTGTICSVAADSTVTLLQTGICSITANQIGDDNYSAAPAVTRTFSVWGTLTPQTITGFAPPTPIGYRLTRVMISATGGASGLPVVFASTTTAVCTVSGVYVTMVSMGTCTLTANQAGNTTYSPAPQVTASMVIQQGTQTITFAALANQRIGAAPFPITATSTSLLPVALTSITPTTCSIANNVVSVLAIGTCSIEANQAGNANFAPAQKWTRAFQIGQAVIAFAAGDAHACVLNNAGGVQCWGKNDKGQLGDATLIVRSKPVTVIGSASGMTGVAAGATHSCAITSAGAAKCWGNNTAGQLGDGSTAVRAGPVAVAGLTSDVIGVVAGAQHSCALLGSGKVKCWGANEQGQLGDNSGASQLSPVLVAGLAPEIKAIRAGRNHTCAIATEGTVQCWGRNDEGQLGNGSTVSAAVPSTALASEIASAAAASSHTCAVNTEGAVVCWGNNASAQLGDGGTTNSVTPVAVLGLDSSIDAVATGAVSSCALTGTGTVQCWGNSVATPANVTTLPTGIAGIGLGNAFTCAYTKAGSMLCWGSNESGQIGDGTLTTRVNPVLVSGLTGGNVQNQSISFYSLIDRKINEPAFALSATATSALPVAFGALTPAVCSVGDSNVSLLAAGYCTIAANQGGDAQFNAAPQQTQSFEVSLVAQAITGFTPAPTMVFQLGATFALSATGGGSGNAVLFTSLTPAVCTVSGNTVALVTAGTCTLAANQAGNAVYNPAPQANATVVITKIVQKIVIDSIGDKVYGVAPFTVNAIGGTSGNPVVFDSMTVPVCTVAGKTVTIRAAGLCRIKATQAGNVNYTVGAAVYASFTVAKAAQVISITPVTEVRVGVAPFALAATTSAGLPVTLVSATPLVCTVSGVTVTVLAVGNCAITADQAGDANHLAASQLVFSFVVAGASQTIAFTAPEAKVANDEPFALIANASSGLNVTFTTSTPLICSVSGSTLTLIDAGTCLIQADQTGNASVAPAAPVTLTLVVGAAAAKAYFVHSDHLDTPRVITDAAENVVWKWESDPFGATQPKESQGNQPAFTHNPRFPGQYYDAETGLHYNYYRDYDPQSGRYIQSDPIGLLGGINTYSYVENDPLRKIDPTGEAAFLAPLVPLATGAGLGAATELSIQAAMNWWNDCDVFDPDNYDWQDVGIAAAVGTVAPGWGSLRRTVKTSRAAIGALRKESANTAARIAKVEGRINAHKDKIGAAVQTQIIVVGGSFVAKTANDINSECKCRSQQVRAK